MIKSTTEVTAKKQSKNIYEVNVAGLPLKLKTAHDPETVTQMVQFVDQKIQDAVESTKSGFQIATLLACMNLAEELILLKKKALLEIERLENRTRRVIAELESSQNMSEGLDH